MGVRVRITDRDNGYKAMKERVFGKARTRVAIGILTGAAADEPHGKGDGTLTVLDVATINEFGSADGLHPPARSFIRAWFDEAEPELRKKLVALMQGVVKGRYTKEQILELIGQVAVGQIQERIADGIAPENADSTVERKGSSTPLIDTGQLRASVTYSVRD